MTAGYRTTEGSNSMCVRWLLSKRSTLLFYGWLVHMYSRLKGMPGNLSNTPTWCGRPSWGTCCLLSSRCQLTWHGWWTRSLRLTRIVPGQIAEAGCSVFVSCNCIMIFTDYTLPNWINARRMYWSERNRDQKASSNYALQNIACSGRSQY